MPLNKIAAGEMSKQGDLGELLAAFSDQQLARKNSSYAKHQTFVYLKI